MKKALIVVDVQKDFCEGGALAVPGGYETAVKIYMYIHNWGDQYDVIAFTKDWHNPLPDTNGGHFALTNEPDYVNTWPVHCVAGTKGAEFEVAFPNYRTDNVFHKGQGRPDYSGFQGYNSDGVSLGNYLFDRGIGAIDVVGIAGDFCVLQTALDARDKMMLPTRILPEYVASVGGSAATLAAVRELDTY